MYTCIYIYVDVDIWIHRAPYRELLLGRSFGFLLGGYEADLDFNLEAHGT